MCIVGWFFCVVLTDFFALCLAAYRVENLLQIYLWSCRYTVIRWSFLRCHPFKKIQWCSSGDCKFAVNLVICIRSRVSASLHYFSLRWLQMHLLLWNTDTKTLVSVLYIDVIKIHSNLVFIFILCKSNDIRYFISFFVVRL